jgi:hypothetical protein
MNWLLSILEKLGRKKVLVDFYGNEIGHRYYLFYYENDEAEKIKLGKFPNIWIHYFPSKENPDGGYEHTHPWTNITFILKGGYTETLNGIDYVRKKGDIIVRKPEEVHCLKECIPGSWSIFYHGFRKKTWNVKLQKCQDVCERCNPHGKCMADGVQVEYSKFFNQFNEDGKENSWKALKWFNGSAEFTKALKRRKAALEKLNISTPTDMDLIKKNQQRNTKLYDSVLKN